MTQGAHNATNPLDNPFWDYSLQVYQQDQCADFLLNAQNLYGFDINMLLFIGWLANNNKTFEEVAPFTTEIARFQMGTIHRIRNLRIRAKCFNNSQFYKQLKILELLAERIEQDRLFSLSKHMPNSLDSFDQRVKKGLCEYLKQVSEGSGFIWEESWLQTFTKYLQPER